MENCLSNLLERALKMRIRNFFLFLYVLLIITISAGEVKAAGDIRNVILISWDAAQLRHVRALMQNNKLPNLRTLANEGGHTEVWIAPFIKRLEGSGEGQVVLNFSEITPDDEIYYEQAVTDSGHARLLTGEWNLKTGVFTPIDNLYKDYVCGNNLEKVYDGLTIMETIKARKPEVKVGVIASRHADIRELLSGYNSLTGIFMGWGDDEIYIHVKFNGQIKIESHGFYSTTFKNAEEDLDYFFDPFTIPHSSLEMYKEEGYVSVYDNQTGDIVGVVELKADFIAQEALDYLESIDQQDQFFLFVHFCEPDIFGHVYGVGDSSDSETRYSQAIMRSDSALGIIMDGLKDLNIYDETLIIVTTDHGGNDNVRAYIAELGGKKWLLKGSPFHGSLDVDNHFLWMVNNKFEQFPYDVYYQTDIFHLILNVLAIE
jgi:hypothetical protein